MRNRTCAALCLVAAGIGYFSAQKPSTEEIETIKYKDRIVRQIVRITDPDGTKKETINEIENRSGSKEVVKRKYNNKKYFIGAAYSVYGEETYQIDTGIYLLKNVALKASYVRQNGDDAILLGAQMDF